MEELSLALKDVRIKRLGDDSFSLKFITSRGINKGVMHHNDGNTAGTVLVGGAGGGLDGPASIYNDLANELLKDGMSSLRLDYRKKNELDDCVLDVIIGIEFLSNLGIDKVGLVGWSFGGAVVIEAGAASDRVRAVATVASQSYGAGRAKELAPKALLLIHGTADRTLPVSCSKDIYSLAREPRELVLYEGANHGIDQNRDEMLHKIREFLVEYLGVE